MDDEAIVQLLEARQESALDALAGKYARLCRGVARNFLSDERDTEECVNDTWLHAWNAIPPEHPKALPAWLARVTRNLAVSRLRALRAQKRGGGEASLALDELSECLGGGTEPQRELDARALGEAINAFLDRLRPPERDLFVARYFFAAGTDELCERTGFSAGRINTQLSRTRRKLKNHLKEEGLW